MNPRDYQRYNPLIRVRETQERIRAQIFAETMIKIKRKEEEIKEISNLQENNMNYIRSMQRKSENLEDISNSFEYIMFLGREKELLEQKKQELEHIAEIQRKELEQIMMEKKKIQKLRDKRQKTFQYWVQKEIQKTTDDLSGIQFSTKIREKR
jgi:flagellar export protein FliJ